MYVNTKQKWRHVSFTLFWVRKTSVIVKTYQLSLHVFICAFRPFFFLSLFLCNPYFSTCPFHMAFFFCFILNQFKDIQGIKYSYLNNSWFVYFSVTFFMKFFTTFLIEIFLNIFNVIFSLTFLMQFFSNIF